MEDGYRNGLVLTGGGARAAYQVGVLSYIVEHAPQVHFPIVTGVSAGAINAAFLAGHRAASTVAVERLADAWANLTVDRVFEVGPASLGMNSARWLLTLAGGGASLGPAVKGLVDTTPLREYLRPRIDFPGIEMNLRIGRLRAIGLTATCYSTGQTITFVQSATPVAGWERSQRRGVEARLDVNHVMASCALPLIFPAIPVNGDYYGDGGVRQAAPLSPAIHLGADRLLAIATRYPRSPRQRPDRVVDGYPPPAQVISVLFNSIFLDALDADAERLERMNRLLEQLPPGARNPDGLREVDLLVVQPSLDIGALAVTYREQLPRTLRFLLRGLGVHRVRRPDLLSYLLFEPPFINKLLELGYEDAHSQWSKIERFLAGERAA